MQNFDFNEALKGIQAGKPITGSDGVLAPLIKQLTEGGFPKLCVTAYTC